MNIHAPVRHSPASANHNSVDVSCSTSARSEAPQHGFEPLEWLVIAIGRRDGSAAASSNPFLEALGRLFGHHHPNQLADPRLEQLRRMAAIAGEWGWQAPPSEMAAFLRAGWSEDQLELLIDRREPRIGRR